MKNKKGFTLIELIAVITVLAIIVLIAVPKVTQIIEDSEKKTIKNSASNLIRTVDMYLVKTNKKYGVVDILDENLNYSGENFEYGQIEINKKGNSRMYAYKEGYCITKTYNGEIEIEESTKEDCSGFVDVLCQAKSTVTNGNKAEGNFNYGDEYSCDLGDGEEKTFYVLENNEDTVSLIMNMNIDSEGKGTTEGNTVAWITEEDYLESGGEITEEKKNDGGPCQYGGYCVTNEYGPVTALTYLKNSTASWTNIEENQINLPSAEQIASASRKTLESMVSGLPLWLYGNCAINTSYWLSTSDGSIYAYYLYNNGNNGGYISDDAIVSNLKSIRPVITISKTQIR